MSNQIRQKQLIPSSGSVVALVPFCARTALNKQVMDTNQTATAIYILPIFGSQICDVYERRDTEDGSLADQLYSNSTSLLLYGCNIIILYF